VEAAEAERFEKRLAQEEAWLRQGVRARRTRNEGRVRRLLAMREARRARRDVAGQATFTLTSGSPSGQLVAEITRLSKGFGDQPVIRDFSARIMRGDRIGLVGPNGIGKTTLLKLLLQESPTTISAGHNSTRRQRCGRRSVQPGAIMSLLPGKAVILWATWRNFCFLHRACAAK
jgi:ATP-binding cassette subfamily F protein uup